MPLAKAFDKWCARKEHGSEEDKAQAGARRFALRLMNVKLAAAFESWRQVYEAVQEARRRLKNAVTRFVNAAAAHAFNAWSDTAAAGLRQGVQLITVQLLDAMKTGVEKGKTLTEALADFNKSSPLQPADLLTDGSLGHGVHRGSEPVKAWKEAGGGLDVEEQGHLNATKVPSALDEADEARPSWQRTYAAYQLTKAQRRHVVALSPKGRATLLEELTDDSVVRLLRRRMAGRTLRSSGIDPEALIQRAASAFVMQSVRRAWNAWAELCAHGADAARKMDLARRVLLKLQQQGLSKGFESWVAMVEAREARLALIRAVYARFLMQVR